MIKKALAFITLIFISSTSFAYTEEGIEAANYLAGEGVIKDYSSEPEKYNLDMEVVRAEMIKITINLTGVTPSDSCEGKFNDIATDSWVCKYAETGLKLGLIASNDNFRPNDNLTKTEAVKMVFKGLGIEKTFDTGVWQQDYMETAYEQGYISSKYTDYDANATREFVFMIAQKALEKEGRKPADYFQEITDESN